MIEFTDENNVEWSYHGDSFFDEKLLSHKDFFNSSKGLEVKVKLSKELLKQFEELVDYNGFKITHAIKNQDESMIYVYNIDPYFIPENLTFKDVPKYIPVIKEGRVIKVYDADTITIAAFVEKKLYRFSVRLLGIDAPEIRTSNETEKEISILARENIKDMIYNKIVKLSEIDLDKYGRILAKVYYNDICVNDWLIEKRFAVKYDGGKKNTPECWKTYYETK